MMVKASVWIIIGIVLLAGYVVLQSEPSTGGDDEFGSIPGGVDDNPDENDQTPPPSDDPSSSSLFVTDIPVFDTQSFAGDVKSYLSSRVCGSGGGKGHVHPSGACVTNPDKTNLLWDGIGRAACSVYVGEIPSSYKGNNQFRDWCWDIGDFIAGYGSANNDWLEYTGSYTSNYYSTGAVGVFFSKMFHTLDEYDGFRDATQKEQWRKSIVNVADRVYNDRSTGTFSMSRCRLFSNQCATLALFMEQTQRWVQSKKEYDDYVDLALSNLYDVEANGAWGERDDRTRKPGYDSYQFQTLEPLSQILALRKGTLLSLSADLGGTLQDELKEGWVFESYWSLPGYEFVTSPTARTERSGGRVAWTQYGIASFLGARYSCEASALANAARQYYSSKSSWLHNNFAFYFHSANYVDLYLLWSEPSVEPCLWKPDVGGDYVQVFTGAELATVKRGEQQFFWSYGNTWPSGGVIGTYRKGSYVCHDAVDGDVSPKCSFDTSFGNEWDTNAKIKILSETPLSIVFETNKGAIEYDISQNGFEINK